MTGVAHGTEMIIELLAKGVSQSQVCSILQVAASTVSEVATAHAQLIEDTAMVARLASVEMDEVRDRLELAALNQLERVLPLECDPLKLARIATSINQMTRRTKGETLRPMTQQVTVTNITLPTSFLEQRQSLRQSVVLNAQSEVVAIGEQTVAPASRAQILEMQAQMQAAPPTINLNQLAAVAVEDI